MTSITIVCEYENLATITYCSPLRSGVVRTITLLPCRCDSKISDEAAAMPTVTVSVSLCVCLSVSVSLSVSDSVCLSLSLSLSVSLFLSFSLCLSLSASVCLPLSFCLSVSFCLFVSLCISFCLLLYECYVRSWCDSLHRTLAYNSHVNTAARKKESGSHIYFTVNPVSADMESQHSLCEHLRRYFSC